MPTPAALRDQTVILSDCQPMAFLCMTPGPQTGVQKSPYYTGRLMCYMDTPKEEASGFHN